MFWLGSGKLERLAELYPNILQFLQKARSTQLQTENWFAGAIDLQAMLPIVKEFKRLWLRWGKANNCFHRWILISICVFTVGYQYQSQKKLRLSLDPSCHHVYICDHHKEMIQVIFLLLDLQSLVVLSKLFRSIKTTSLTKRCHEI